MASYCTAGETARVTFPNGSIQEFVDTPINISVNQDLIRCGAYTLKIVGSYIQAGALFRNQQISLTGKEFFGGIRLNGYTLEIFDNLYNCPAQSPAWRNAHTFTRDYLSFQLLEKISNANYRIIITGKNGDELHNQTYSTNNYSVECIGCPDGTLNCGDCCLPCEGTFNQISEIRSLLSRTK